MKQFSFFIALFISMVMFTSCAHRQQAYKETTTVTSTTSTAPVATTVVTEETTTTAPVVEGERASGGSILGGIFRVVGEVIAFPFKLIGTALGAIF